jgi:WD40 repeat protein
MKNRLILSIILLTMTLSGTNAQFRGPSLGFFQGFTDVGSPSIPGTAVYSEPDQVYWMSGSGSNIWFGEDSFSFLWKEMSGDYILQAELQFIGEGTDPHRKAGLMIRSGLTADAPHVSCVIHGDGLTSLQYRKSAGNDMQEVQFEISGPDVIQLEKKGDIYTMSVARRGEIYMKESLELPIGEDLMAGLFICSHNDTVSEKVKFHNVRIFGTEPEGFVQYREYLGSLLEVMDVETGHRRILDGAPGSWQAPNWTHDGKTLIYNADGLLYNFDLETGTSSVLPTGFANRNNNDHVISFDGTQLAISHHTEEDQGQSVIYTLPLEGGIPTRITPNSPSYLHGWSPDNKYLIFTGGRDDVYNIYRIPAAGGEEEKLTDESTLDDGPEYSPDGKYIYFNSARTGTMQIWRMEANGSNPTQLTFDEHNDWFPHVSPDNRWIVFISFPKEVPAADHPFYKRVYLRIMSVEDLKPRVIGYLYGGQGTINVPSWSPDSKKIAFVSNGIFQ